MIVSYKTLFAVNFNHTYYSNLVFNGFEVTPLPKTRQYLEKRQLLLKTRAGGFSLLLNDDLVDIESKKKLLMSERFPIRFVLNLTDPYLYNYTANLPENDLSATIFYFKNWLQKAEDGTVDSKLHQGNYVNTNDCVPSKVLNGVTFQKPFGIVSIQLYNNIPDQYTITFEAKGTYWKYILVSDYFKELQYPGISSADKVEFSGPETVDLPDTSTAICFQSKTPIKLAQNCPDKFQLVENYQAGGGKSRIIKRALPTPDVKQVSCYSPKGYPSSNYSEIYIY
jgi:hypothetical protein